ncbi:MAG: hypothetical protein KGR71_16570, partial [Proteobacteria bacterium]|nr:hypothetical protein [Pseudomonadota bacterium]
MVAMMMAFGAMCKGKATGKSEHGGQYDDEGFHGVSSVGWDAHGTLARFLIAREPFRSLWFPTKRG